MGDEAERVVVVGAAAAATYELGPAVGDLRRTLDVDLVVEVASRVAVDQSRRYRFTDAESVRIITPLYFAATKVEAFLSPERAGHGDFHASHDIEDLLAVLVGMPSLIDEIAVGRDAVHITLRQRLSAFLKNEAFRDAVSSQLPHAFQASARRDFFVRLSTAAIEPP